MDASVVKTTRLKRTFTEEEKKNILNNIDSAISNGTKITVAIENAGIHAPSYYQWKKKYSSSVTPVASVVEEVSDDMESEEDVNEVVERNLDMLEEESVFDDDDDEDEDDED